MIDLSICIPTYERSHLLDKLLENLSLQLGNSDLTVEIIVSDNASTDATQIVVKKWEKHLPIINLRQDSTIKALQNIQSAFSRASGTFCLYLSDDDELIWQEVEKITAHLKAHPEIGVAYAPWICAPDNGQPVKFFSIPESILIEVGAHANLLLNILKYRILPETFIFRTSLRNAINIHDSKIAQTFLTVISDVLDITNIIFWPSPFYIQRIHSYQSGHEESIYHTDQYRGGLEYIISRAVPDENDQMRFDFQRLIDDYAADRLIVSLRLRIAFKIGTHLDNYLLGRRIIGLGRGSDMPRSIDELAKLSKE